ncbi:unnamed protein product [Caenorhabditis brenneri]
MKPILLIFAVLVAYAAAQGANKTPEDQYKELLARGIDKKYVDEWIASGKQYYKESVESKGNQTALKTAWYDRVFRDKKMMSIWPKDQAAKLDKWHKENPDYKDFEGPYSVEKHPILFVKNPSDVFPGANKTVEQQYKELLASGIDKKYVEEWIQSEQKYYKETVDSKGNQNKLRKAWNDRQLRSIKIEKSMPKDQYKKLRKWQIENKGFKAFESPYKIKGPFEEFLDVGIEKKYVDQLRIIWADQFKKLAAVKGDQRKTNQVIEESFNRILALKMPKDQEKKYLDIVDEAQELNDAQ